MTDKLRYAAFKTPRGWVAMLGSYKGLLQTTLPWRSREDALDELSLELGDAGEDESAFSALADKLRRYFSGKEMDFTSVAISIGHLPAFERGALEAAAAIPYGQTVSYGELAVRAGSPKAARAVGQAMKKNPLPIVIPCHRVIKGDGSIGGYGGKPELKRELLRQEGVEIPS